MINSLLLKLAHSVISEPFLKQSVCIHKPLTSCGADLAPSLLLYCKLPASPLLSGKRLEVMLSH